MKITIFGGCGFVGFNVAKHLAAAGHKVTVADNLVRRGSELALPKLKKLGIEFVHCDVRNKEDFIGLGTPHVVLNCAAQPSAINYSNPEFDITNNTFGTLNILEYARRCQAAVILWSTNKCYSGKLVNSVPRKVVDQRFVWDTHFSNGTSHGVNFGMVGWSMKGFNEDLSVNGVDHSIYGVSKIAADLLVQEWSDAYKIPAICNRFSCLAGPEQWGKAEQGWVTWFAIANELELPIEVFGFSGYQVRDCLFIGDLCRLIEKQVNQPRHYGEFFNVGGGTKISTSINEAINLLSNNKQWKEIKSGPERRADQAIYISDITKVSQEFGWEPVISMEQGYEEILKWVKTNKELLKEIYS